MNLYKKCTPNLYYFLVIDTTLASDNPLCFRKNLLKRIKLIITNADKIRDEKLNTILTEKQQKYLHHHHLVKLTDKNMLQVKKYYNLIKVK